MEAEAGRRATRHALRALRSQSDWNLTLGELEAIGKAKAAARKAAARKVEAEGELACVGECTWAQRVAALRAQAVLLND